jgi:hypothetical protein
MKRTLWRFLSAPFIRPFKKSPLSHRHSKKFPLSYRHSKSFASPIVIPKKFPFSHRHSKTGLDAIPTLKSFPISICVCAVKRQNCDPLPQHFGILDGSQIPSFTAWSFIQIQGLDRCAESRETMKMGFFFFSLFSVVVCENFTAEGFT